ncbi:hypothetical protein CTA2_9187, partial [Colletotrichum tanaceti]
VPVGFFKSRYFERRPSDNVPAGAPPSQTIGRHVSRTTHLWVRQGIRKEVNKARVLLYRHRELADGVTLDDLADDLIKQVWSERYGPQRSRPLFFIAHSVGGLVVKMALLKATKSELHKPFMYNCHGISFFATPHRGSSYLSMNNLKDSIRRLLRLQRPLPRSISDYLRLGHKPLLAMHDDFSKIASELGIWTFYETIDSQLSGFGSSSDPGSGPGSGPGSTSRGLLAKEVRFGAPIASIKSSLVGVQQERVFSLDSDHADCASFGEADAETMAGYLRELAAAVGKATDLSAMHAHTPLNLKTRVKVEIVGFFEDPDDAETESAIRLYFTKPHLQDFLDNGPEQCLEERLTRTALRPSSGSAQAPVSASVDNIRRMQSLKVPALLPPGFGRPSSSGSRSSNAAESTRSDPTELELPPRAAANAEPEVELGVEKSHSEPLYRRRDRLSRASALDDLTAVFSRPDPASRKFMWIHTPYTNPSWVKDVLGKLSKPHDPSFIKVSNSDNWAAKHVIGRHSQAQASFVKPACNFIPPGSGKAHPMDLMSDYPYSHVLTPPPLTAPSTSPHPSPSLSGRTSPGSGPSSGYLYVYLPFLHFDTYINVLRRRNFIKRRMQHGRARPVPREIAELESTELRMIWEYIGYDPPLNYRRTLDQFAYPSLRDTWARDDDQMLYKLTKDHAPGGAGRDPLGLQRRQTSGSAWSPAEKLTPSSTGLLDEEPANTEDEDQDLEEAIRDGKVLMVDQLWLWAIDTTTLSTFFNRRESKPKEGPLFQQADLRNSVYNELNGDLTGRCENALDLAAFVVLHAVTVLLDRSSHPDLEVFRIFEEAISMLTERMTSSLKRFRMQTFKDFGGGGGVDSDSDSDADSNRPESIKKRHKRELEEAERENRETTSVLMELRDLEDELKSLKRLFEAQDGVVWSMKAVLGADDEVRRQTHNGRMYLDEALGKLDEYKSQTAEMLRRVDTTRNDYEKLHEMVQRKAQVDEVRWSRLQTELASSQNLSVMIFTTFTVIFLPLSFFASLFGMNTAEWEGHFPSIRFVGAVSLPLSAFIIAAALVAAFSGRAQGLVRTAYKAGKGVVGAAAALLGGLVPREWRERKHAKRAERTERKPKRRDRGYDFWESTRRERASKYRIPEVNRNNRARV